MTEGSNGRKQLLRVRREAERMGCAGREQMQNLRPQRVQLPLQGWALFLLQGEDRKEIGLQLLLAQLLLGLGLLRKVAIISKLSCPKCGTGVGRPD
jgi:hypothetical protein